MAYILDDINSRAKKDPAAFIRECDAEYDEKICRAADLIEKHREVSPIVLMSGPSGSGKNDHFNKNRRGAFAARNNYLCPFYG